MKRYIYLLFVFCEKIHEILGFEYPGGQGDLLPCLVSRENPLSTLCVLLFELSCNTRSKNFTLFCIFWQPGRSIALFAEIFCLNGSFIIRSDLFGIYVIGLFGSLIIRSDLFGIYVIGLFGSLIWVRAF